MNAKRTTLLFLFSVVCLTLLGWLAGCSNSSNSTSAKDSGTVAIAMTDAVAEDYDHIWLSLWKIELIAEHEAYTLFESAQPVDIDILALNEYSEIFFVGSTVPVGTYGKLRLHVEDFYMEPPPLEPLTLPGHKIDLNPKGAINVMPGDTLVIELDFDMEKTLSVSNSGVLRPIIFVNIVLAPDENPDPDQGTVACNKISRIRGPILAVEPELDGYTVEPANSLTEVEVNLSETGNVYRVTDPGELTLSSLAQTDFGIVAAAYGWIHSEQDALPTFSAQVVQVGDSFLQRPITGQLTNINVGGMSIEFTSADDEYVVDYSIATLFTCDGEMLAASELEGLALPVEAKVDGLLLSGNNLLQATTVIIKTCICDREWAGEVASMNLEQFQLTVSMQNGEQQCLQLRDNANIIYQLKSSGDLMPRNMSTLEQNLRWKVWAYEDGNNVYSECIEVKEMILEEF